MLKNNIVWLQELSRNHHRVLDRELTSHAVFLMIAHQRVNSTQVQYLYKNENVTTPLTSVFSKFKIEAFQNILKGLLCRWQTNLEWSLEGSLCNKNEPHLNCRNYAMNEKYAMHYIRETSFSRLAWGSIWMNSDCRLWQTFY